MCLLALAACGNEQPSAHQAQTGGSNVNDMAIPATMRGDIQPVMGKELRIALWLEGAQDSNLAPQERVPAMLEAALRARGINARVQVIASQAQLAKTLAEKADSSTMLIVAGSVDTGPANKAGQGAASIASQADVPVVSVHFSDARLQRKELFNEDGAMLSAAGAEELASMARDAVMAKFSGAAAALPQPAL